MALTSDKTTVINLINTYIKENGNNEITGALLNTILQAIVTLVCPSVTGTFDNGDLDGSYEFEILHELDTLLPQVLVYDENSKLQGAANIGISIVDVDTVKLSLQTTISGTWSYLIIKHD